MLFAHNYDKEDIGQGQMLCSKTCAITGEIYSVVVDVELYKIWKSGAHIQDVFPHLDKDQREFLISGTTPAEWNEMFKEMEE